MQHRQIHKVVTSTYIVEDKLGIPTNYKNKCIEEAYVLGDAMNKSTNVKAIHSTWGIWEQTNVFNPLLNNIVAFCKPFAPPNCIMQLRSAWSAIYKKGDYTVSHDHLPTFLSFVYYLKSTGNTPLIFSDSDFKINPTDDTLIIFPGYLKHEVPKHKDNSDRICLAGNFILELNKEYYEDRDRE